MMSIILKMCMMINIQIQAVDGAHDDLDAAAVRRRATGFRVAKRGARAQGGDLAARYTGEGKCVSMEKQRS
jgi:hypothetical protein